MKELSMSPTGYSLLGFLTWGPASGYDLRRIVDRSVAYFWPVSHTQIYNELRRLVASGYATERHVAQDDKPDKRVYRITAKGRDAFKDWLARPGGEISMRDPLTFKVFFGTEIDAPLLDEEPAAAEKRAKQARDELKEVAARRTSAVGPEAAA